MAAGVKQTPLSSAMAPVYHDVIDMVTNQQTRFATLLLTRLLSGNAASINAPDIREQFQTRTQSCRDASAATITHEVISGDTPFSYLMNNKSSRVSSTPHCRPMQVTAIETTISDPECKGKLLVMDCTGGRKSHILQMIATFIGGIIVAIVPLLALTNDQMAKIEV